MPIVSCSRTFCNYRSVAVRGPLIHNSGARSSPQSNPVADLILLRNIGSYFHHSESTPLPPNALSLFRPWLLMQGHEDAVVYNVDYSLQEPHLIL